MSDLPKYGGSAAAALVRGIRDALVDRPNLSLCMPTIAKAGDDAPSSSSGENFFRGFRLQFPGFSKQDPTAAAAERSDSETAVNEDEPCDGDSSQVIPDTPSPVLLINKKRLHHVPSRLRDPINASKKLRLEGASNGACSTSALAEPEDPQSTVVAAEEAPEKPAEPKAPLVRENSDDSGSHVLDETLATIHKIVADTSKIMEKLCTNRKTADAATSKETDKTAVSDVSEKSKTVCGDDAVDRLDAVADEPKAAGSAVLRDATKRSERSKTTDEILANLSENVADALRETERFRCGSDDSTQGKAGKPAFHWPSPKASSPKVAVVSPLPSATADQRGGNSRLDKASTSHQGGDRPGRSISMPLTRPAAHRGSRKDHSFPLVSSSSDEEGGYVPHNFKPHPRSKKPVKKLIDYSSDSIDSDDSEDGAVDSLRRAVGGKDAAAAVTSPRSAAKQEHGSRGNQRLRFLLSSSSDEGEKKNQTVLDGGTGRSRLRDVTRYRMENPTRQESRAAYLLERLRGPWLPPTSKSTAANRQETPEESDAVDPLTFRSGDDEDSDLEVLNYVKPSKARGSPRQSTRFRNSRDCVACAPTDAGEETFQHHRPGTSRAFAEVPSSCNHQRSGCSHQAPQLSPTGRGRRTNHGKGRHGSQSYVRRLDMEFFDDELSSDDDGGRGSPPRPRHPARIRSAARRIARIISSSSDTDVDVASAAKLVPLRREERTVSALLQRRREERAASASPVFNSGPLAVVAGDAASAPVARGGRGGHRSGYKKIASRRVNRLDSPGERDAVLRIEQIENDEAFARRLQAAFDEELTVDVPVPARQPQPQPQLVASAVVAERDFTPPLRSGPSAPRRYSRNRNASPRMVSTTSGFRSSRPRQPTTRAPNQQSLLSAARHRASGGRMRGASSFEGMASVIPMMDGGHLNRMLLGFQDEWMSLIASVAVQTIESDPEQTSRGRSPRSLRRRPAARANASSDDTDIDGIAFESLLTYSDDEDDYWQAGIRPAPNQTGRTGARRRSRGRRAHGNYWTPNQGNDYEELLELAERLGHVSRGLNRTQINRLPTHLFGKPAATEGGSGGNGGGGGGGGANRPTECHICMSDYENGERLRILPCFHDFHTNCIDRWLREKNTCPVCRLRVQVS